MEPTTPTQMPLLERLSWEEIRRRHVDEWVMLVEVDWLNDDDLDFRSAIVVGRGATRRQAHRAAAERSREFDGGTCLFTGERLVPDGPVYLSNVLRR